MSRRCVDDRSGGAWLRLGASVALAMAGMVTVPAARADEAPGLRVFKDPATGQLRAPTPEEVEALRLQEARARSASGAAASALGVISKTTPRMVVRADGSRKMELTERSMSYSVVKRRVDGTLDMNCVTGEDTAETLLKSKTIAATRVVKEVGHDQE